MNNNILEIDFESDYEEIFWIYDNTPVLVHKYGDKIMNTGDYYLTDTKFICKNLSVNGKGIIKDDKKVIPFQFFGKPIIKYGRECNKMIKVVLKKLNDEGIYYHRYEYNDPWLYYLYLLNFKIECSSVDIFVPTAFEIEFKREDNFEIIVYKYKNSKFIRNVISDGKKELLKSLYEPLRRPKIEINRFTPITIITLFFILIFYVLFDTFNREIFNGNIIIFSFDKVLTGINSIKKFENNTKNGLTI